jgi:hypothetical protein
MTLAARSDFHDITHPKKRAFLAAYIVQGTITHAARLAGIERTSHNDWLADPVYAAAFERAKAMAAETVEREIIRRGVEGIDKPVYWQGKRVDTIRDYSDTLLIFQAKKLMPEYRDVPRTPSIEIAGGTDASGRVVFVVRMGERELGGEAEAK